MTKKNDVYYFTVTNINYRSTTDELYNFFSQLGKIIEMYVVINNRNESRGMAIIGYDSPVLKDKSQGASCMLDGRRIRIGKTRPVDMKDYQKFLKKFDDAIDFKKVQKPKMKPKLKDVILPDSSLLPQKVFISPSMIEEQNKKQNETHSVAYDLLHSEADESGEGYSLREKRMLQNRKADREREKDLERQRSKEHRRDRDRRDHDDSIDRKRSRDRERELDHERDRDRYREYDRERDRGRDRDRDFSRDRDRDRDRERSHDYHSERSRSRERDYPYDIHERDHYPARNLLLPPPHGELIGYPPESLSHHHHHYGIPAPSDYQHYRDIRQPADPLFQYNRVLASRAAASVPIPGLPPTVIQPIFDLAAQRIAGVQPNQPINASLADYSRINAQNQLQQIQEIGGLQVVGPRLNGFKPPVLPPPPSSLLPPPPPQNVQMMHHGRRVDDDPRSPSMQQIQLPDSLKQRPMNLPPHPMKLPPIPPPPPPSRIMIGSDPSLLPPPPPHLRRDHM